MERAKKRIRTPSPPSPSPSPPPYPEDIDDLPWMFDPESSEWKAMSILLPVLKEEAEAPREVKLLDDWIAVSESAICLIKFLSRRDLIEECDKLPCRINGLKEASRVSRFDYTPLIRYAEGIYADAADLRGKGFNALKDDEEETVEDLRAQTEIQFADLALIKYQRQLKEVTISRAKEQRGQLVVMLERSIRQVDELKRQIGMDEQLQQTLQAQLDDLRQKEAEAEAGKKLDETQGKVFDIPPSTYQEQSRLVLGRAKALSFLEPGPTPLSLAFESARTTMSWPKWPREPTIVLGQQPKAVPGPSESARTRLLRPKGPSEPAIMLGQGSLKAVPELSESEQSESARARLVLGRRTKTVPGSSESARTVLVLRRQNAVPGPNESARTGLVLCPKAAGEDPVSSGARTSSPRK